MTEKVNFCSAATWKPGADGTNACAWQAESSSLKTTLVILGHMRRESFSWVATKYYMILSNNGLLGADAPNLIFGNFGTKILGREQYRRVQVRRR